LKSFRVGSRPDNALSGYLLRTGDYTQKPAFWEGVKMADELAEKNLPEEGDQDQRTGKVWHSGAWWDELEWQQYLLDRERQQ
jgi:hypothetical protein